MTVVAEYTSYLGKSVQIVSTPTGYEAISDGVTVQNNMSPDEAVKYLSHLLHNTNYLLVEANKQPIITVFHVEWCAGVFLGRFFSTRKTAEAYAQMKAEATRHPTKVTEASLGSCTPECITLVLNDEDEFPGLIWHDDTAKTFQPEGDE